MGCRCGGGPPQKPRSQDKPKPPVPRSDKPPVHVVNTELKFCDKCGWMLAKVSYVDVKTKQKIQRWTCANRKCPNYNP
jgi:ribosomal protein L37AE/L43A